MEDFFTILGQIIVSIFGLAFLITLAGFVLKIMWVAIRWTYGF